jgi:dienelactone hydrolase
MKLTEFEITVGRRKLPCILGEPDGVPAADPGIVLSFCGVRREAMVAEHHDRAARVFIDAGHRALSFDMPHHGERIGAYAPGIDGARDALLAGDDPWATFIDDAKAAVDAVLERKLARPGRIYSSGVSRGAYAALRHMAEDPRISGTAAYAPITDWREMREFAAVREDPRIAATVLDHWVDRFVGRAVYFAIGNADRRVGVHTVAGFVYKLLDAEAKAGVVDSKHAFHFVNNSKAHAINEPWRTRGGEYLLGLMNE